MSPADTWGRGFWKRMKSKGLGGAGGDWCAGNGAEGLCGEVGGHEVRVSWEGEGDGGYHMYDLEGQG